MAERKIGAKTYKVEPLPVGEALELLAQIMAAVGPAAQRLPALIISMNEQGDHAPVMTDVSALMAMSDIIKSIGPAGVRELVGRIVGVARVLSPSGGGYDRVLLDDDFENLSSVIPVVHFVLSEQYGDFFTGSAGTGITGRLMGLLLRMK